jgi:septum site-determining protein MinC
MKKSKTPHLIECKGSTAAVIVVTLRSLDPVVLAGAAEAMFAGSDFFEGDAGLLDIAQAGETGAEIDWPGIVACLTAYGLQPIGVRGGSPAAHAAARAAGLAVFPEVRPAPAVTEKPLPPAENPPAAEEIAPPKSTLQTAVGEPATAPTKASAPADVAEIPAAGAARPTRVVDRPLRSGQLVYARGGDLVVLAAVNPGAEVIADGSIHVYAPLRGRALAGASGDRTARIFTTRFEAELVSIAGVYRTFEGGVPEEFAGQPVQVSADADGKRLTLAGLRLD